MVLHSLLRKPFKYNLNVTSSSLFLLSLLYYKAKWLLFIGIELLLFIFSFLFLSKKTRMNYTSASVQFVQWTCTLSQLFSNNGKRSGKEKKKTVRKCIWEHSLVTEWKHAYFTLQIILQLQPGCIWKRHLYGSWLFRCTISHRSYLKWLSEA